MVLIHQWLQKKLFCFFFPPTCLFCRQHTQFLFCQYCAVAFEFAEVLIRCPFCVIADQSLNRKACPICEHSDRRLQVSTAVNLSEPVGIMINNIYNGQMPYLIKTAAAFMFLRLEQLQWRLPDLIIPAPDPVRCKNKRVSFLLARALQKFLNVAWADCFKQHVFCLHRLCRAWMNRKESVYSLKKGSSVKNKDVLLIDLTMENRAKLQNAVTVLVQEKVKSVRILTFA